MAAENPKAKKINDETVKEILKRQGKRPNLAIILIGSDSHSEKFISKLEETAKKLGIDTHLYKCHETDSQESVISTIEFLNNDDLIDSILLKLPIPTNFDSEKILSCLNPDKEITQVFSDDGEDMDIALLFQNILKLSK